MSAPPPEEHEEVGSKSGSVGFQKAWLQDILKRFEAVGVAFKELRDENKVEFSKLSGIIEKQREEIGGMKVVLGEIRGVSQVHDMKSVIERLTSLEVWRGEIKGRVAMTAGLIAGIISLIGLALNVWKGR